MKLFVIVICLLSERYLMHKISTKRFAWFNRYVEFIEKYIKPPAVILLLSVLLIPLAVCLFTYILGNLLFGFIGLLINICVFIYCLGPTNPFYPRINVDDWDEERVGKYFISANNELFAVIFYYAVLGIFGVLVYRLVEQCQQIKVVASLVQKLVALLEWIPARITALTYLLVGNFQAGIDDFARGVLLPPAQNDELIKVSGLKAVTNGDTGVEIIDAERQVEHALLLQLTIFAIFTLVIWL